MQLNGWEKRNFSRSNIGAAFSWAIAKADSNSSTSFSNLQVFTHRRCWFDEVIMTNIIILPSSRCSSLVSQTFFLDYIPIDQNAKPSPLLRGVEHPRLSVRKWPSNIWAFHLASLRSRVWSVQLQAWRFFNALLNFLLLLMIIDFVE
jgi:hypothetical protein